MELLRIKPRLEWEDSDSEEDVSCGAHLPKGRAWFALEADKMLSESGGTDRAENDLSFASFSTAVTTSNERGELETLGMNLFDPNAACWKHWERYVCKNRGLLSGLMVSPKYDDGQQTLLGPLDHLSRAREHYKVCAAYWRNQRCESCRFHHGVECRMRRGRQQKAWQRQQMRNADQGGAREEHARTGPIGHMTLATQASSSFTTSDRA
eukprot:TRINITY_DN18913_c0_g1_i4.p1 TRINITY_DN18913_c0_g1~~TRINITY_DN18913_c0_g1_i4.p1  ORF type:complete len:234 (-),score=1.74 TRINITY_DN18913_c0_g1_i4:96-722(-)